MRCLFTLIITLLGLASLAAGGFLLYTSFIDTPEVRTDTLGGASQTQRDIAVDVADEGGYDPPVVVDGNRASANNIGTVELSEADQADLLDSPLEIEENAAVHDLELAEDVSTAQREQAQEAGIDAVFRDEVLTADTSVEVRSISTSNDSPIESTDGQGGGGVGAGIEQRVVEFEWPQEFRTGEAGSLRLTLKALPSGGLEASVAEIPTNAVIATPILMTDCYDDYTATATATIVAPAFEIEDTSNASQPLNRGSEVTWRWSLTPDEEGTFIITLAINLQWSLKPGATGESSALCSTLAQLPISLWGQSVQVEVSKVLGFITIQEASIAGTVLAVLGFVAELPFMGEVFSVLFERRLESRADRKRQRKAERDAKRRRR